MKTYTGILSILLILTVGIVAAQTDLNATDGKMDPNKTTDGKMLYNYITKDSNYKMWQMWPGKEEFYPGKEPHGALLTTYVTDDALSAIESGTGTSDGSAVTLPDGSIIVKENYLPDKTLVAYTVMYKEAGYDPEHNDWFWVRYLPNGTITAEGKVKGCIDCHSQPKVEFNNQINDYIFTSKLQIEEPVIPTETPAETETIPPTIPPTPVPTKSPGFGAIMGIIGLISVMYLFKKRKNR